MGLWGFSTNQVIIIFVKWWFVGLAFFFAWKGDANVAVFFSIFVVAYEVLFLLEMTREFKRRNDERERMLSDATRADEDTVIKARAWDLLRWIAKQDSLEDIPRMKTETEIVFRRMNGAASRAYAEVDEHGPDCRACGLHPIMEGDVDV